MSHIRSDILFSWYPGTALCHRWHKAVYFITKRGESYCANHQRDGRAEYPSQLFIRDAKTSPPWVLFLTIEEDSTMQIATMIKRNIW